MSLYYYLTGQQSWRDHVNNRDLATQFDRTSERVLLELERNAQHRAAETRATQNRMSETLHEMSSTLEYALEGVESGIDQLRSDFNFLLGDVIWKLETQTAQLQELASLVRNPVDTAATELRKRAEDAYSNGWYGEALKDATEAAEKNYRDFTVHRLVGNIYLYHEVDLPKACESFRRAAKYALPRDRRQAAEAHYFAGMSCGLQQLHRDALGEMEIAIDLNAEFYEAVYMASVFSALIGDAERCVRHLKCCIRGDARYHERARKDPAFKQVGGAATAFLRAVLVDIRQRTESKRDALASRVQRYTAISEVARVELGQLAGRIAQLGCSAASLADWLAASDEASRAETATRQFEESHSRTELRPEGVFAIASSDHCSRLAFILDDGRTALYDTTTNRELRWPSAQRARSIDIHPTMSLLAVVVAGDGIEIRDAKSGNEQRTFEAGGKLKRIRFHPFEPLLVCALYDGTIELWDVLDGHKVRTLWQHSGHVTDAAFSVDGKLVLSGGADRSLRLWNVSTGKQLRRIDDQCGCVTRISIGGAGGVAAACGHDGVIVVLNVPDLNVRWRKQAHSGTVTGLAVTPTGEHVISGGFDSSIRVWEATSGACLSMAGTSSPVSDLVLHRDTNELVVAMKASVEVMPIGSFRIVPEAESIAPGCIEIPGVAPAIPPAVGLSQGDENLRRERRKSGCCEICGAKIGLISRALYGEFRCKEHRFVS